MARGYQVQTQYPVGYYRIDLVVMGENSRLAVECDGDKYHSGSEKIAEDLARQAILERLGWQFYRIRGSVFFREPEQALAGLWQRLADLGIQPKTNESSETQNHEMLHLEIIRLVEKMETVIEPETVVEEIASTPAIEERRLLCGNSAQFQGDERDVILLSMVDSNEGDGVMRLQGDGARDMYKKRYNVAVSRARDQLWIVHSVNYQTDLKPNDLRRQL